MNDLYGDPDLPRFDGVTYAPEHDCDRLSGQLARVRESLADGQWWTLARLAGVVGGSEAGVSARLRDLRKPRFGAHVILRRRVAEGAGMWEYRMEPPT